MACRLRAPHSMAHTANPKIAPSGCRLPWALRGSGTRPNTSISDNLPSGSCPCVIAHPPKPLDAPTPYLLLFSLQASCYPRFLNNRKTLYWMVGAIDRGVVARDHIYPRTELTTTPLRVTNEPLLVESYHTLETVMDFDRTLALLADLKERRQLFVSLTPPFAASLEIDREILREALVRPGDSEDEFRRFADEIGNMLFAHLARAVDRYVEHRLEMAEDEDGGMAGRQRLETMVSQVKQSLYDDHLQRRYDLKRSSKAPSFTSVDWDIKTKHFDANLESFVPFPYATFRISFQKDFGDSPLMFLGGRAMDSVQINFSIDEIDHLRGVLLRVRERLQTLELTEEDNG